MITFERLHPAHIRYIEVQSVQTEEVMHAMTPEATEALAQYPGFSAWASGVCLGAGGFILQWPGRALCWLLLSKHVGRHMTGLVRRARAEIEAYSASCARLEMHVRADFRQGHRLALMLGFSAEALDMPKFFPDGASATLYARVK